MADASGRLSAALSGRYGIERELGEGGMATVYLAEDLKHRRMVALKVLKPELAALVGADRFLTEIETTANLQHPHILPLFDSGEADGFLYYVMPWIEGESLQGRLDREHQLPIGEALAIAEKVAAALQYAHEQGVVHRDIKPDNILLSRGEPLVADFGIALAVSHARGGRLTETGLSVGTPHYMSPEQAAGEREIDPRSDVYSLACVLYEMLTGQPPFGGTTGQAVLARILTGEPDRPTAHRRSVPAHVEAALLKALERLPADRFASAAAFAAALENPSFGADARRPAGAGAATAAPRSSPGRRLLPWAIAVLAVAVAVASTVFRRGGPDRHPLRVDLMPPAGTEFSEFRFAALSPDGSKLAFVGLRPAGGRVLWIRDLESGRTDSLHAASGAQAPFWSPDGKAIGYFAAGNLRRIQADGTAAQSLCDTPDVGGSWSSRGAIVFTRLGHPMTVAAGGGACTPVRGAWTDSSKTVTEPAWLPDGIHFAATDGGINIVVSDVAGDAPRLMIADAGDVHFVAPDLIVFAKGSPGGADIVAQHFEPGTLALVGSPTTLAHDVRAASGVTSYAVTDSALVYLHATRTDQGPLVVDERGVIVDSIAQQGSWTLRLANGHPLLALAGDGVWEYDLERRTAVVVRGASAMYAFPVWSPDDTILAVARWSPHCAVSLLRLRSGTDTIIVNERESHRRLLCSSPSDWTRDGRFLVLTMIPAGSPDHGEIWTYEPATGKLDKLVAVDGAASAGVVSPDERWLAYVSDETGELEVYVRPFRSAGAAVRVSTRGGGNPRWSGDGRALFYIAPDGWVVRVPVPAGPDLRPGSPEALFAAPRWSIRLFADQAGGQQQTTPFDVSADGKRFFVRQRSETTQAGNLVLGWRALLGEKAEP